MGNQKLDFSFEFFLESSFKDPLSCTVRESVDDLSYKRNGLSYGVTDPWARDLSEQFAGLPLGLLLRLQTFRRHPQPLQGLRLRGLGCRDHHFLLRFRHRNRRCHRPRQRNYHRHHHRPVK